MALLGLGALVGGGFLGAVVDFGVTFAASIGISYAAQALAGKSSTPATEASHFSTQGTIQAGGAVPRSILFGATSTAGSLVYHNTWGTSDDGKSPNAYYTKVIRLCDVPIQALTGIWVNGEKCTLGALDAEKGYAVTEYNKDGADHVWIKFYDGTQTTADSFLTTKVSSADRPYQSTRVGVGVPYAIATALVEDTLFTGFPDYIFEVTGMKLYDPTQDSTNGGSGSHRFSDPSTWGGDGDYLPAVQAYNVLRGIRYNGVWLYGLQQTVQANLPAVNWNAQIAKCRTPIAGVGGNEPTYRSAGQITVDSQPADALDALMTACQGKLSEVGGYYKVHLGAPDGYSFAFTDSDILSTEEQTFDPFLSLADSINGITATYPDPTQAWATVSAPALYNSTYEAQDGSRRLLATPSFDFVPYAAQVQRLMRSALLAARRERKHNIILPPPFWSAEPGDICSWTSTRNGYDSKLFEVVAITDKDNLDVGLALQEVDPSDYDWDHDTDYTAPTSGPTVFPRPEPQGILAWAAVGYTLLDKDGYTRRPAIQLSWDGDVPGCVGVQYELAHQDPGSGDWITIDRNRTDQLGAGALIIWAGLIANEPYRVRGQYIPSAPRDMLWSDWIDVTTPDVRLSLIDFDAALHAQVTQIQQQVQDVVNSTQALIASIAANQDARNWVDKTQVQSQITSRSDAAFAAITEVQTVATDTQTALASFTTEVTAQFGTVNADISTNSTAIATLNGYAAAQYSVTLNVNGYATGFNLLNGGAGTSAFIVVSDKFQIQLPGYNGGTPQSVFTTGTLNGSAAIGISGNVYLDGTITARSMSVGALSAITANLGSITAGTLTSTNGKWVQDLNGGTLIISD